MSLPSATSERTLFTPGGRSINWFVRENRTPEAIERAVVQVDGFHIEASLHEPRGGGVVVDDLRDNVARARVSKIPDASSSARTA